uniref:CCDC144C domain-containing protein n=1 Tax=Macrostomum lignano TaxID=282301 RepID=A0A1I8JRX4_9PLAT
RCLGHHWTIWLRAWRRRSWQLDSDTEQIVTSSHAHLLSALSWLKPAKNPTGCSVASRSWKGERADWNESRLSQLEEISRADRMLSSYASAENDLQTANSRLAGETGRRCETRRIVGGRTGGGQSSTELLESNLALTEARRELESQLNRKSAEPRAETQQQQHEAEQEQLQAEKEDSLPAVARTRLNDEAKELRAVAVAAAAQAVDAKVGVEDDLNDLSNDKDELQRQYVRQLQENSALRGEVDSRRRHGERPLNGDSTRELRAEPRPAREARDAARSCTASDDQIRNCTNATYRNACRRRLRGVDQAVVNSSRRGGSENEDQA